MPHPRNLHDSPARNRLRFHTPLSRFKWVILIAILLLIAGCLLGLPHCSGPVGNVQDARRMYRDQMPPAFPGAEGFGTRSSGSPPARATVRVTTLAPNGPGSLRAALAVKRPRTIEFDVSGTILLQSDLEIHNPWVEVLGETAPPPGITLAGAGLRVRTHDVLIRHIRVRPGDRPEGPPPENRDGISIEGDAHGETQVFNVVIDHCSVSWAIDEGIALWYAGVRDVTISNCLIAENLSQSLHPKDEHSKGLLVGDHVKRVAIIGNLFAHNMARNPLMKGDTSVLIVNNLIYNPGRHAIHFADDGWLSGGRKGPALATVIGNTIIAGPDTPSNGSLLHFHRVSKGTRVYWKDNLLSGRPIFPWSIRGEWKQYRTTKPPVDCRPLTIRPADRVEGWVLDNAGARPQSRDAVDTRIIDTVRSREGSIIDTVPPAVPKSDR